MSWEAGTGDIPAFSSTGEDFLTIFGTKGSISVPSLYVSAAIFLSIQDLCFQNTISL